jgi:ankyrin repeat protein
LDAVNVRRGCLLVVALCAVVVLTVSLVYIDALALYAYSRGWQSAGRYLVESALAQDARLNGRTIVHAATARNDIALVRRALVRSVDPNVLSDSGVAAIHIAAWLNRVEIAGILLDAGVLPDIALPNGENALSIAIEKGHHALFRLLLERGAQCDTPRRPGYLYLAARYSRLDMIDALVQCGQNFENQLPQHPLFAASRWGNRPTVEKVLSFGISPNLVDPDGETPLTTAAAQCRADTVAGLLEAGADPKLRNRDNMTPLELAVRQCRAGGRAECCAARDALQRAME